MATITAASNPPTPPTPPTNEHTPEPPKAAEPDLSLAGAQPPGERAGRAGRVAERPALGYNLLRPPEYDDIVGGLPPSPFVSAILLGAIIVLGAATILSASGGDATQWWELGGMFLAVAVFLAAFVSRA